MRNARRFVTICCIGAALFWIAASIGVNAGQALNINSASVEQLAQLKGIGEIIAARIVEYRTKNGPFKTPEDIMKVKGIGQKTFERIKDLIVAGK